jgi:hypothetical protein
MRVQSIAADLGVRLNYDQFYTRAICHGDRDPSGLSIGAKDDKGSSSRDGYPLMTCHAGCSYPTIRAALIEAGVSSAWMRSTGQPAQNTTAKREVVLRSGNEVTQKYVPHEIWLRAHDALFGAHSERLAYLEESRGLTRETVKELCIGWHKGRYSIPVFDERGCVTLRLYKPDGNPKIKYLKGYGQNRLYIPGDALHRDQRTLYCAGEWDAILAHQNGWQSVTHTGGEGAAPPAIDLVVLAGHQIVVAYDNDDAGRAGAVKTAAAVAPLAQNVSIADLSAFVGPKGDVGDLLLSGQGLGAVLAAAEPWAREVGGRREVDWAEFWANDPEPIRYLIDPLFAAGEVTRVFAPAKVGKSLLVLEAMAGLATGREVLGETPTPTHVVYVDQENTPDDWRDRLESMGYDASDDMSRLHWYSLQSWPPLDTADGGEAIIRTVQEHLAEVVVIDTQSKVLEGPEDKSDTAAAFYRHTLLPLKRIGCAVVIIDHAGNDESKPRGSSGKRDDVDVVWKVSRSGDAVSLARTHTRKRHELDRLSLRRELNPTRHVVRNGSAEPARAFESRVEACMEVIASLDLPPRPSGRAVTQAIRKSSHKFENKVIAEAWNRLKETVGGQE